VSLINHDTKRFYRRPFILIISFFYSFNSDDVQYNGRPQLTDKMVRATTATTTSCYHTTLLVYKHYKYKHVHDKCRHHNKHPLLGGRRKNARQVGNRHHDIEFSVVRHKVRCTYHFVGYVVNTMQAFWGVNSLEFLVRGNFLLRLFSFFRFVLRGELTLKTFLWWDFSNENEFSIC